MLYLDVHDPRWVDGLGIPAPVKHIERSPCRHTMTTPEQNTDEQQQQENEVEQRRTSRLSIVRDSANNVPARGFPSDLTSWPCLSGAPQRRVALTQPRDGQL